MTLPLEQPDQAAFNSQELLARCLGRLDFAIRVLNKFQTQLELDLAMLEQAVRNHNRAAAALAAHRIKGASANVAAHGLQQCAAEIEMMAAQENESWPDLAELHQQRRRFADSAAMFAGVSHG